MKVMSIIYSYFTYAVNYLAVLFISVLAFNEDSSVNYFI